MRERCGEALRHGNMNGQNVETKLLTRPSTTRSHRIGFLRKLNKEIFQEGICCIYCCCLLKEELIDWLLCVNLHFWRQSPSWRVTFKQLDLQTKLCLQKCFQCSKLNITRRCCDYRFKYYTANVCTTNKSCNVSWNLLERILNIIVSELEQILSRRMFMTKTVLEYWFLFISGLGVTLPSWNQLQVRVHGDVPVVTDSLSF